MEYEIGNIVTGIISGITKYGVFVKLDNSYTGLVHISEISEKFVSNINDFVTIGQRIKLKIISIDEEKKQLSLSIKRINYKNQATHNEYNRHHIPSDFATLYTKRKFWIKEYLKNKKIYKYY